MFLRTFAITGLTTLTLGTTSAIPETRMVASGGAATARELAVELKGRVLDAVTNQPLASAQVRATVVGAPWGAISQADGQYLLLLPDAALGQEIELTVRLIGYETQRHTVRVSAGAHTVDFRLKTTALALDALTVSTDGRRQAGEAAAQAAERRRLSAQPSAPPRAQFDSLRSYRDPTALSDRDPHDREAYALIEENGFVAVGQEPLSTFSIDVDRASYANVRRFINEGRRPPVDAVRIEELVNYFSYSDPAPDAEDEHPLWITTEAGPAPWQPLHHLVRIGVQARRVDMSDAPPSNLVFLLDVSGSMSSENKLPLLKKSFGLLVEQLRPGDRVAIVVYAGAAGLVLPSTSGDDKTAILESLEELRAGGSTAGGAGLALAYAVAAENHIEGGNNRVILATDGDFNVGASSDAEMVRLIEEKREQGTFLTVLGFGTGNLQDAKMEQIADHGNGNYAYIDNLLEAKKVLVNEMGGTLLTLAKDVKLQVEFNPAHVAAYRLIGYENRMLAAEDFNDDTKDAGELGAGHAVMALYEVVPVGVESPVEVRTVDRLRYQRNDEPEVTPDNEELMFVKLRYKDPDGTQSKLVTRRLEEIVHDTSHDFRFAAAVAAWGMLLRDSEYCPEFTLNEVARMARGALGEDIGGYRADFLSLVDRARSMELLEREPGSY